jgi:hypothetical protein
MKTFWILGLVAVAMTASASAQNIAAPARAPQTQRQKAPRAISGRDVTGVIPRAIRGGNPLQMLNPRAPARYGTAEESVVYEPNYPRRSVISDPSYPGKWRGIKFFTILF